ncbi:hypothetical protein D0C16_20940 [Cellvibrio sp. KY-GH-1]|nr:hypothetical protein D0C16_20940 [Cellvibrio sp. KY-GH-1]
MTGLIGVSGDFREIKKPLQKTVAAEKLVLTNSVTPSNDKGKTPDKTCGSDHKTRTAEVKYLGGFNTLFVI